MLKFFRRIRRKLSAEGSFRKYLVYAIGEILLVVIGILIALQINTSSEQAKNREKEFYYMNVLLKELVDDTLRYNRNLEIFSEQEKAAKYVYETIISGVLPPTDSLHFTQQFFLMIQRGEELGLRTPIIWSELQSTGNLDLINDKILLDQLYLYYNQIEKMRLLVTNSAGQSGPIQLGRKKNTQILNLDELEDQLEDFKIDASYSTATFKTIFNDNEYLEVAKGVFALMKVNKSRLGSVNRLAKSTIIQLKKSIDNH